MIHEPHNLEDVRNLDTSVCIVGGGPAGISLALELADTGIAVLLLESGGLKFDQHVQDLYKGKNLGQAYPSLDSVRLRYFGGTSNHWNGWCAPLTELMFAGRSSWEGSAWSLDPNELKAPYERAQQLCQLSAFSNYSERFESLSESAGGKSDPNISRFLARRIFQFSPPTRFGSVYLGPLKSAKNVDVQLGATVTELVATEDGNTIREAVAVTHSGRRISIKAKLFVLATGGLENVRLLLNSTRNDPRGIGNAYGLVGRYFMEHLHVPEAAIAITHGPPSDWEIFDFTKRIKRDGVTLKVDITLPDEVFAKSDLPTCDFRADDFQELSEIGRRSLRTMYRSLAALSIPDQFGLHLRNVARFPLEAINGASLIRFKHRLFRRGGGPYRFSIGASMEQPPYADSRVVLDRTVDRLGQRRIALDWRVPEQVYLDFHQIMLELGKRMIFGKLGTIQILVDSYESFLQKLKWQWHHMGTTRMARRPQDGVVDENCRVHGVKNLFIAGSSVFPNGGSVNPTLTICALSVRLGRFIKQNMRPTTP